MDHLRDIGPLAMSPMPRLLEQTPTVDDINKEEHKLFYTSPEPPLAKAKASGESSSSYLRIEGSFLQDEK